MSTKTQLNLRQTLGDNAGQVYRIAVTLCGQVKAADKITRKVLNKSISQFRHWETDQDAARWFARFTILCTRSCSEPDPKRDLLRAIATDPETFGMIHAFRNLPMQQREAFVLHHGQLMDLRQMATAMDCSATAAATHLTAATQELRQFSAGSLIDFTSGFPTLMHRLTPPSEQLKTQITNTISRRRIRRVFRFGFLWPLTLLFFAAVIWGGFHLWNMLVI